MGAVWCHLSDFTPGQANGRLEFFVSSPSPSLSSSQGRSNPFRVGSPGKKASGVHGKSFFDSVEEEKKALLLRKNKICELCYIALD